MRTLLCVYPTRVEPLFPPGLLKSYSQIPLAFNVWFSGNSSSCCWSPRLGSLTWGSEPSLQWVDFCGISVLQFLSHPPSGYGIWFYCDCAPPTISLWLLLCLWLWISLLVSSSAFLLMIVQQLFVIPDALAGGSECVSFYSAILNESHLRLYYYLGFHPNHRVRCFPPISDCGPGSSCQFFWMLALTKQGTRF